MTKTPRQRSQWVRLRSRTVSDYRLSIKLTTLRKYGLPKGPDGKRMVTSRTANLTR